MDKFPQAIKDVPQWAVCGFKNNGSSDKQPYVWDNELGNMVPLRKDGNERHPPNLHLLMDFESVQQCIKYYNMNGHSLMAGFYLMPSDPFCCIDMDIKTEWDAETIQKAGARYEQIVRSFHSYTEISRSGNGLHLWVYALPQEGKRRDGVEIYTQYRFMICTGNHWNISPLEVAGKPGHESETYIAELLYNMRSQMNGVSLLDGFEMVELTEEEYENDPYAIKDEDLYIKACEASNGNLFRQLWDGRYLNGDVNYDIGERSFPSQSEAEFALVDIIAFYTKYNFQVRRMFYMSKMGDRYFDERRAIHDKVKKPYHLDRMIKRRRMDEQVSNMEREAIMKANIQRTLEQKQKQYEASLPAPAPSEFLATDGNYTIEADGGLDWPPGAAGELARYMFAISLRPVKDIAILSALALLSGVCGKAWNTHTRGGLNNYFILVARSGLGKDAFRSNIQNVLQTVEMFGGKDGTQLFGARSFLDTAHYGSEQALMKSVIVADGAMDRLSFVHYMDEIAKFFKGIAAGYGKAPELEHAMLTLYNQSAFYSRADGFKYSNKENNHAGGRLAAYSLAGECTPDEFYSTVTQDMLSGGFISRLTIWDCDVLRPLENKNAVQPMPEGLLRGLGELITQAVKLHAGTEPCTVKLDHEAGQAYDNLDVEINKLLNGVNGNIETDEVVRQAHNRRAFKILKIACLLAVADNCYNPEVTMRHFEWASTFINTSNERIIKKHKQGLIGSDDINCDRLVLSKIKSLVEKRNGRDQANYPLLTQNFVLTKSDLRAHTINLAAFSKGRSKKEMFENAVRSVIDLGAMQPLSRAELQNPPYTDGISKPFSGTAYRIDLVKVDQLIENM